MVNNTVSNITQTMGGQDMEIKSNTTLDLDAEVKEVTPDIHLSNTITRLHQFVLTFNNFISLDVRS